VLINTTGTSITPTATKPALCWIHDLCSRKTREALHGADHEKFHVTIRPPGRRLAAVTFDHALQAWPNGDTLDLVHFDFRRTPDTTSTSIFTGRSPAPG